VKLLQCQVSSPTEGVTETENNLPARNRCVPGLAELPMSSEEYELATLLARSILGMLSSAKQRNMAPPLELVVTGADDELVTRCSCQQGTKGDIELCALPGTTKLSARFPLTATLTDANGETLEQTITRKPYDAQ
jgi:hypothetical protein